MNKTANLILVRVGIATALCLSFLIYTPPRLSSARAATCPTVDLKSESQLRSEASRYDAAIRAIGGIATMKIETAGDLKRALDLLNREHQNLHFRFSKLVVLALSDPTFSNAVKARTAAGRQAAEAFAGELTADGKTVFRLNGAEALRARLQRSDEADAKTLRGAADRFAEKAKSLGKTLLPVTSVRPTAAAYQEMLERALIAGAIVVGGLSLDVTVLLELAEQLCLKEAAERYQKCLAENPLPPASTGGESIDADDLARFLTPIGGRSACSATFLYDQRACSGLPFPGQPF